LYGLILKINFKNKNNILKNVPHRSAKNALKEVGTSASTPDLNIWH
jgi:hypothetical protein